MRHRLRGQYRRSLGSVLNVSFGRSEGQGVEEIDRIYLVDGSRYAFRISVPTAMSSSISGQCTPTPLPISRQLRR